MIRFFSLLLFVLALQVSFCKGQALWHNKERLVHYLPDGNDFICTNPTMRFNRALYGTNTAFRVEAGDLPEFAMYMPGMGGNLRFALMKGNKVKWLIEAKHIKAIYRAGSMLYEISDSLLGSGVLSIAVLALSSAEGMVVKINSKNISRDVKLVWIYGGASGKKFSRDGDIGADPESSFYLKAENCLDNLYQLFNGKFILSYGTGKVLTEEERYEIQTKKENELAGEIPKNAKQITGLFPPASVIKLIDPDHLQDAFNQMEPVPKLQCVSGILPLTNNNEFFVLHNSATPVFKNPEQEFTDAEAARKKLSQRIVITTPDRYINTLGGVLSVAADAIWEEPTYMHGAVAWRMRLPGWRGAYVADPLGWHDRARTHFNAYALSQLTNTATEAVVMDTALNLARHVEKVGTQLFSNGYITRNPNGYVGAHHYDMNLIFIDELLNHFNYTGDTAYVKKMFPLIKKHLAWEKKNFDADGDGLYDAYAAIWASDALQYSGGGVTHSSAYNYRSNKDAAKLALLIGEDGTAYEKEANKILDAINKNLWMPDKGWYAEYKDLLGNKLVHPFAGLWTVYHAIDEGIANPFQAYQSLRYVDNNIPHIPVKAKGLGDTTLYTLSTTNWQPYTWSLNNVALAELLHTSLAYWQSGRSEEAYKLWKSSLIETMYLGSSPGNIQQLSFYDAIRGELYRDFADPIAMTARSLVEGLFGIKPDALNNKLVIQPGFPASWNNASIKTPDINFDFKRNGAVDKYLVSQNFTKQLQLVFLIEAIRDDVQSVFVNGKPVAWKFADSIIGKPMLQLNLSAAKEYHIEIKWKGNLIEHIKYKEEINRGEQFKVTLNKARIINVYHQQPNFSIARYTPGILLATANTTGRHSFFVNTIQGKFNWWQPVGVTISKNSSKEKKRVSDAVSYFKVDLSNSFNDEVSNIFKNKYLSPRPVSPTLQLPVQGIGNWAYHSTTANITDSGLKNKAGQMNEIKTSNNIPFRISSTVSEKNIVFTSMWDNYPDSVVIALQGKAWYAHLLMAGSTNPMQSRLLNGEVIFNYKDGTADTLELKNPENWWRIEQDYYVDGFAFTTDAPKPIRISLKSGEEIPANYKYTSIKGFSNFTIDGGAATVLDLPLNETKELKNLVLRTIANDVVIGLMALTLER